MKKTNVLAVITALVAFVLTIGVVAAMGARSGPVSASARVTVPNVVGMRMDQSTRTLHNHGLRVNEECSGFFGCIVKANWFICTQSPRAGMRVQQYSVVVTYGARRGRC
jgi:PASTA domain